MKCAVITPIGPGHEEAYQVCRRSIEAAWDHGHGPFEALEILPMWDLEGKHGRSARRNTGIDEAAALGCDWLFFLDADDLMNLGAFAAFAKYCDHFDAVWGNICENVFGSDEVKLRENQLISTTRIEDILSTPPFLTLQMGHFVRTACAQAVKFDVDMDTGEDFKYYLGLWSRFRCAKVAEVFFINRRGHHSGGPRSANGAQWTQAVQKVVLDHCKGRELYCDVAFDNKVTRFAIDNPFDIIQQHHALGQFFEIDELRVLREVVGSGKSIVEVGANVGNHLAFYAQHMKPKRIFPFEPNPAAVNLLTRNIEANGFAPVVDQRGIGIGAGARYGTFSVVLPYDDNLGAARLAHGGAEEGTEQVEVYPLDERLKGEAVDFIKIDVEGMEFDVLDGASELISRNKPVLMVEVFRDKIPAFESWCATHGYAVKTSFPCVHAVNFLAVAA